MAVDTTNQVLIGSILLEPNRHKNGKVPTFRVSEWLDRFAADGFNGVELWENHATLCDNAERTALAASTFPITIYNMYGAFDDASAAGRDSAVAMSMLLNSPAIKFNLGKDKTRLDEYLRNLCEWKDRFPADTRLICECHPGTPVEEPEDALRMFEEMADPRLEAMVHPVSRDRELTVLRSWMKVCPSDVKHAHIQMREGDGRKVLRLDRDPEFIREAIDIMRDAGYTGGYTLEFTEGTNTEGENIEELYDNALRDLALLKEIL